MTAFDKITSHPKVRNLLIAYTTVDTQMDPLTMCEDYPEIATPEDTAEFKAFDDAWVKAEDALVDDLYKNYPPYRNKIDEIIDYGKQRLVKEFGDQYFRDQPLPLGIQELRDKAIAAGSKIDRTKDFVEISEDYEFALAIKQRDETGVMHWEGYNHSFVLDETDEASNPHRLVREKNEACE